METKIEPGINEEETGLQEYRFHEKIIFVDEACVRHGLARKVNTVATNTISFTNMISRKN